MIAIVSIAAAATCAQASLVLLQVSANITIKTPQSPPVDWFSNFFKEGASLKYVPVCKKEDDWINEELQRKHEKSNAEDWTSRANTSLRAKDSARRRKQLQTRKSLDTPHGSWTLPNCSNQYYLDSGVAAFYGELMAGQSVVELGAGCGCYSYQLENDFKVKSVQAFDGVANIANLTDNLVTTKDLATDISLEIPLHDWTICTEVGEHIPNEYEDTVFKNIVANVKRGVILSWAVPGQNGDGHVNCQTNEYVIKKMESHGFKLDTEKTKRLRAVAILHWFKDTMMAFMKDRPYQ